MTTVDVEVDLYSGRENPGWRLDDADAVRFVERVATLSSLPASNVAPPDRLGYRGLRVMVAFDGTQRRFVLADAVVFVEPGDPGARRMLADPERALEKWLLVTGRSVLGAALVDRLVGPS